MVIKDELVKVNVFEGLSESQLEKIVDITDVVLYEEGQEIHHESSNAKHLFVLTKGEVHLQVQLSSHNQQVTVGMINQANQCFGWSGVIAPHYYTATAICRKESEVLVIDGQELLDILESEPIIGFRIIKGIAQIISSRLRNCRMALLKTM